MTHPLRFWVLLLGFGVSALTAATSCSKKEDAAPTTGSITGTVTPSTAVTLVTATDASNQATSATPNDDSGAFSIANLKAGTYTVTFATAPGYLSVRDRSVSVAAGQTNSLGAIQVGAFVAAAGSVDGTVSPAGSVDFVQLTAPGSTQGPTVQPDIMGYFRFPNVSPGTYNVSFRAVYPTYLTPAPRIATVVGSATASLGTIVVNPAGTVSAPLRGSVHWQADGLAYVSTNLTGNVFLDNGSPTGFSFTATSLTGTTANILSLYGGGTNPGLYLIGNSVNSATYLRTYNGVPGPTYETRFRNGNVGTITVTAFDATARTVSGTFGFTAYEPPLSMGAVTVSGGSFTLAY